MKTKNKLMLMLSFVFLVELCTCWMNIAAAMFDRKKRENNNVLV